MLTVWSGWWCDRKTWVTDLRGDPELAQRVEDQRPVGDHPRVDDDQRVAVADEDDGGADAVGRS